PFPFDYDLHQKKDKWPMRRPLVRRDGEGQALGLFVRMYDITQEAQWRESADYTFRSFYNLPSSTEPWVVHDDQWGYLWFEGYAKPPVSESDRTYNGHMFAVFSMCGTTTASAGTPRRSRCRTAGSRRCGATRRP
ncbi:MAG TPA: hypothetical protein VI076_16115, partial [Actinopolymorphaceae bacterium]